MKKDDLRIPLPKGTEIGEYVIESFLAWGGSCLTYMAHKKETLTKCIIKEAYPWGEELEREGVIVTCKDAEKAQRIRREMQQLFHNETEAANSVKVYRGSNSERVFEHRNITEMVWSIPAFSDTICSYICIDTTYGKTLLDIADMVPAPSLLESLIYVREATITIHELLHENRKIHADIKPNNLFFPLEFRIEQMHCKLLDFGSFISLDDMNDETWFSSSGLFSPPEIAYGPLVDNIGTHSDIYSLAVTLIFLILGREQFEKEGATISADTINGKTIIKRIKCEQEDYLENYVPHFICQRVRRFLRKCLQTESRPSDEEFIIEINAWIEIMQKKGVHPEVIAEKSREHFSRLLRNANVKFEGDPIYNENLFVREWFSSVGTEGETEDRTPEDLISYVVSTLKMDKHHFILTADGGYGKTTSLIEMYRFCHSSMLNCNGKRIVPLYVPLVLCTTTSSTAIREYLFSTYVGIENVSEGYALCVFENTILDNNDSQYIYLLMLDAINENFYGKSLISEIEDLSCMENVCVILTSRYMISEFSGWTKIKLQALSDRAVADTVGEVGLDSSTRSLLRNPFYLSKYRTLMSCNSECKELQGFSAYSLLDMYYTWIINKQIRANRTAFSEVIDTFEEQENSVCNVLLPSLCFFMSRKHTVFLDSHTLSEERWIDEIVVDKDAMRTIERMIRRNGVKATIDNYFVPLGIITVIDGGYKIEHEIYRDFLCAKYISDNIILGRRIPGPNVRFNSDVLNMVANACICKEGFSDANGIVHTTMEEMKVLFFPSKAKSSVDAGFSNYCLIIYNLLEEYSNGTQEKENFCREILRISRLFYELLKIRLAKEGLVVDEKILESIRIHAEILRRCGLYDETVETNEFLTLQCARSTVELGSEYLAKARHVKAKCKLYTAFDFAKRNIKYNPQAKARYFEAIKELGDLAESNYIPSRNLYAMLLAYPDLVSEKYVLAFFEGQSMQKRRENAFYINFRSVENEYIKNDQSINYHYPLQQCAAALLQGDASCYTRRDIIDMFDFDELIRGGFLSFGKFEQSRKASSLQLAGKMIRHLMQKKDAEILSCLYAKKMLLEGCGEKEMLRIYLKQSKKQPLSIFLNSLLYHDNDVEVIEQLQKTLLKRASERSPDSYDAIYIQDDMKFVWNHFVSQKTKYESNYCEAVRMLLSCDLKGVRL